jgi:hypothetical protein
VIEDHDRDDEQDIDFDGEIEGSPAGDDTPESRPWVASVLAALCVLALIGGIALVIWLDNETEKTAQAEQDRVAAMQAAETFTETWNTFRPKDASTYVDRVSPLLSEKFKTEFEDASEDVVAGITQQRLFSKGEVLTDEGVPLVGIATIDPDSAEVLVVSDAKRVANRQRVLRHWRWQVSLIKKDGEWLVDSFKEV